MTKLEELKAAYDAAEAAWADAYAAYIAAREDADAAGGTARDAWSEAAACVACAAAWDAYEAELKKQEEKKND